MLRKARWSFGTGLTNVDDIRERRCMWTLRGWKETDEEGNEKMVAEEIPAEKPRAEKIQKSNEEDIEKLDYEPENSTAEENLNSTWSGLEGHEAVRSVYKRACYTHCHEKALIHMKFAAFEESLENIEAAKEILNTLLKRYNN